MTQDEIRKLLGGYATDALTPDERRTLFQAALEDQELFEALSNEDALKELLDDPVTRAQVRAALGPRRRQFHARRWLLGVAIPAVVAVVLIVTMNRAGAPRLVATNQVETPAPVVTAPVGPAPAEAAPAAAVPKERKRAARVAQPRLKARQAEATAPAPASATPPVAPLARPNIVALSGSSSALATLRAPGPAPVPPGVVRQFDEGFPSDAPLYQGPLVRYAVMRGGPNGRAIQVQVTAGIAGYLALYEVDPAGRTIRVYPAGEVAARIVPNLPVQIPPKPIEIHEAGAKLRLVLVRAPMAAVNATATAQEFVPRTQGAISAAKVLDAPMRPLVVEIPLAP